MLVDVPVNEKAQAQIRSLRGQMEGLNAILDMYNRYQPEEDFQKTIYAIRQMESMINNSIYELVTLRPQMIEKRI